MDLKHSPLYAESWNVAYRFIESGSIIKDQETVFHIIPNASKYWAADPMVFNYKGKIYIFAELYDYSLCRGTIGYTVYDGERFDTWRQVIVEGFHLSYPFLFQINDEVFMLPESSASHQLILYRAINFPTEWKIAKVIAENVWWVDTTIYKIKRGFIGFTQEISDPTIDLKLLFDEELNLLSKEIIAENAKRYRCGGRIFEYKGEVIRVCQDCGEDYGKALVFRFCSLYNFSERKSIIINPEQLNYDKTILLDGMHTYTSLKNIEVIDLKTRRFSFRNLFYRILSKIKNYIRKVKFLYGDTTS